MATICAVFNAEKQGTSVEWAEALPEALLEALLEAAKAG